MKAARFAIADELTVEFEDLPNSLERKIRSYLGYFAADAAETTTRAQVRFSSAPPPARSGESRSVVQGEDLRVLEDAESITFELPGITGWVRPARQDGGLWLDDPSDEMGDRFVSLALAPMLIELAQTTDLFGVHAAAVAVAGRGILLPGPSGSGKSTLFRNCARAGLDLLSDDLVWISGDSESGLPAASSDYPLYPFPRGRFAEQAPEPTVASAPLAAIVCPSIVEREDSRLVPLEPAKALDTLLGESGFLAWSRGAAPRFSFLARLAGARPAFRLEAGRKRVDAASLLKALLADDCRTSERPG